MIPSGLRSTRRIDVTHKNLCQRKHTPSSRLDTLKVSRESALTSVVPNARSSGGLDNLNYCYQFMVSGGNNALYPSRAYSPPTSCGVCYSHDSDIPQQTSERRLRSPATLGRRLSHFASESQATNANMNSTYSIYRQLEGNTRSTVKRPRVTSIAMGPGPFSRPNGRRHLVCQL